MNDAGACCDAHAAEILSVTVMQQDFVPNPSASGAPGNQAEFPPDVYCPKCGYCLQGARGDRCPECGYSLANMRSCVCRIPWANRTKRNRLRAYWRTVWMVTFRNRQFCEEYARPVNYRDARTFQLLTILLVFAGTLLVVMFLYPGFLDDKLIPAGFDQEPMQLQLQRAFAEIWPIAVVLTCFLLFLVAATGAPSYFFHPRALPVRRQNASVALCYYTSGPMLLTPLILLVVLIADTPRYLVPWPADAGLHALALIVLFAMLPWWLNLVQLARRTMPQLKRRWMLVATATPLCWIASITLLLVALPAIVFWVVIVVVSLN